MVQKSPLSIQNLVLTLTALAKVSLTATYTTTKVSVILRTGPSSEQKSTYNNHIHPRLHNNDKLTEGGQRMMYNLGLELKERYKALLVDQVKETVRVYSSQKGNSVSSASLIKLAMDKDIQAEAEVFARDPPLKNLDYKFEGASALPTGFNMPPDVHASDFASEPLFYNSLLEACPSAFYKVYMHPHDPYDPEFDNLRLDLRNLGISPEGVRSEKGWDQINLEILFDAAESHKSYTGEMFPKLTEEVYNKLWLFKTYALESNFFHKHSNLMHIWTNNLMNNTMKFFTNHYQNGSAQKMRVYVTEGAQLYAFKRLLHKPSHTCLKEINNGTRDYPFPIGTSKPTDLDNCYLFPRSGSMVVFEQATRSDSNETFIRTLVDDEPIDVGCYNITDDFYCELTSFRNSLYYSLFGFEYSKSCKTRQVEIEERIIKHTVYAKEYKYLTIASFSLSAIGLLCMFCTKMTTSSKLNSAFEENLPMSSERRNSRELRRRPKSSRGQTGHQSIEILKEQGLDMEGGGLDFESSNQLSFDK